MGCFCIYLLLYIVNSLDCPDSEVNGFLTTDAGCPLHLETFTQDDGLRDIYLVGDTMRTTLHMNIECSIGHAGYLLCRQCGLPSRVCHMKGNAAEYVAWRAIRQSYQQEICLPRQETTAGFRL